MFQNVQIRSKLIAILVGPLLALIILSSVGIGTNLAQSAEADRVNRLSLFAGKLNGLVNELQEERSRSAVYLGARRRQGQDQLTAQRPVTDRMVADYRAAAADLELATSGGDRRGIREIEAVITYGLNELNKLPLQRRQVDGGRLPTESLASPAEPEEEVALSNTGIPSDHGAIDSTKAALNQYTDTIGDLLNVTDQMTYQGVATDSELLRGLVTSSALARAKEFADVQRGIVGRVLASGGHFAPGEHAVLVAVVAGEQVWLSRFEANADVAARGRYDNTVTGPDVEAAEQFRQKALASVSAPRVAIDGKQWYTVTSRRLDLMRKVELATSADVNAIGAALKRSADRRALLYSIALTIVLWVAVGLSLLTARSMVGPLRRLKAAAEKVARRTLPGVVERLQRGERVDLDAEATSPVDIHSKDEIGQVAEAFNTVHRVAVRVAGEQAALRKSVGDMFLNLARRSQGLVDRQLELIDDLERGEADPDALENLFRLDHLATRMRRNAENLIVLSGSEPARRWSDPVPLIDVVRAAIAEVEDYTRVELLPIEPLSLSGQAVSDVVHLLAELIENATSFSPPGTKVQVAGQHVSSGYVVEVEDRGLGMTDAELVEANERLANPPMIDFALSRMLGIFVVGRLASRYGIKVQLRHSWYGGVTALVLFPENLVVRPPGATVPLPPPPDSALAPAQLPAPDVMPALSELPAPPLPPVDRSQLDSLPIFEAARSDWFQDGPDGSHLPLRRHAAQLGSAAAGADEQAATPRGPEPPAVDGRPGAWPEAPRPAKPKADDQPEPVADGPAKPKADDQPEPVADRPANGPAPVNGTVPADAAAAGGPTGTPSPPANGPLTPPGSPSSAEPEVHVTKAGLPRRIPRANLAPEMLSGGQPAEPPTPTGTRTPTEVRTMLSSYRSGLERGRSAASSSRRQEPEQEAGDGTPSSSRSDHDAAQ
jgi:HAMP domain-containing protein